MTNTTYEMQRLTAVAGAPRRSDRSRLSTTWSIGVVAAAPKPCAHVATKDFGANATLHPRPEEAPL